MRRYEKDASKDYARWKIAGYAPGGLAVLELTVDFVPKPWEKFGELVERTTHYSYKMSS